MTDNIVKAVIQALFQTNTTYEIIAAARNVNGAKEKLADYPDLKFRTFDFEAAHSFDAAINDMDILFLLRPPHISDVKKYLQPLLKSALENGIQKCVFLSV